jgi:hypothetical protein
LPTVRLRKSPIGRTCPSDDGLVFVSLGRSQGWRLEVRRPGREPFSHEGPTLAVLTTFARQFWRPSFLLPLLRGLPADHPARALFAQAVRGEAEALVALLEAAEAAGQTFNPLEVLKQARHHQVPVGHLGETSWERAARRLERVARARQLAARLARLAHQGRLRASRGFFHVETCGFSTFQDQHPPAPDGSGWPPFLDLARQRLKAEGIEELARAWHPEDGNGRGLAVVYALSAGQSFRLEQAVQQALREAPQ